MSPSPSGMRVLMVISSLGAAGAENQLAHLAIGLARAGHDVTLVALRLVRRDCAPLADAGVRVIDLGRRKRITRPAVLPALARLARQADVVHCTSWDASLWGRMAAAMTRRPAIVTEHTPGREFPVSMSGSPRARWIAWHYRLLDPFTYAVVAVARWQASLLEREGVRADAIVHIPNGVPVQQLRAAAQHGCDRTELDVPDDALAVVHVARFAVQKNQAVTYETVQQLRAELGEVHALFVGDGEGAPPLRARAERDGAEWAHFLGRRSDVARLLALSDLAVLPSSGEGMPMVILEAIAVGTPVVATDVGDVGSVVRGSGAGICVPPDDPDAFRDACRAALTDPTLRPRLTAAAAAAAPEFDAAEMTARYERLFMAAVERRPVRDAIGPVSPLADPSSS
jgi:L-malate glycosyltransferase